jgi:hypothetical protein
MFARSAQCLKSIYESLTFIFTDLRTIQAWFGVCPVPSEWKPVFKGHIPPPAFFNYGRSFELSLAPDFGRSLICGNKNRLDCIAEHPHDGYDFHWLHLPLFHNLHTVKIWVSARSKTHRFDPQEIVFGIKELDMTSLADSMSAFRRIASVTISTPLGPSFEIEEGVVNDFVLSNVTLYKRGSGDRFHPWLNIIGDRLEKYQNNLIHTCRTGYVRSCDSD